MATSVFSQLLNLVHRVGGRADRTGRTTGDGVQGQATDSAATGGQHAPERSAGKGRARVPDRRIQGETREFMTR